MKDIRLVFEKSQTRLAGFPFGETVYKEQVKNEILETGDRKECYKIIFPIQIEKVASSFIQGFFSELINSIGYEEIEKKFIIETSSEKLTNRIKENIY